MTKEEVLAMKAGRELNLLVCGKVFDNKTFGSVKPYSTDISVAWQVVEKMNDLGYLPILWSGITETGYLLKFAFSKSFTQHAHADCTSLNKIPEAICKAALLAKLEKGD